MTKAELIKRHGVEWYEQYNARRRERYKNDSEFRETHKTQQNTQQKERRNNDAEYKSRRNLGNRIWKQSRYVIDRRIDLVENYELAKAEDFKDWDLHHRTEVTENDDYIGYILYKDLIAKDLYYNRPPEELIWLRHSEHSKLHMRARLYGCRII